MNNDNGVYKLTERMGDHTEAISILLRIINRIDCKRLLDQMQLIANKSDMTEDTRWAMGKVYNYQDGMGKFDSNLEKAIGIAEKRENRLLVCGDEGWFLILEFL